MHIPLNVLLADSGMASGLNKYLDHSASLAQHGWIIGAAVCGAVMWFLYPFVKHRQNTKRRTEQKTTAPRRKSVFSELCDRHGLEADERRVLDLAARQAQLDSPSVLFVDPAALHQLSRSQPEHADACDALIQRLFTPPQPAGV